MSPLKPITQKQKTASILCVLLLFAVVIVLTISLKGGSLREPSSGFSAETVSDIPKSTANPSSCAESTGEAVTNFSTASAFEESSTPPAPTLEEFFSDTLFIGDSRIEGLFLYTDLSGYSEFYSRVGLNINDALEDPFVSLGGKKVTIPEALKTEHFSKIYIMLGFNELGWPNDSIFIEKYRTLIDKILSLQPDAVIYLQSLIHVTAEHSAGDKYENNERINMYNKNIEALANGKNILYIDLNPCFDDKNKALKKDSTTDGIHLKPKYYDIWVEYLISYFQNTAIPPQ